MTNYDVVTPEGKRFSVIHGQRWTRVPEYLSNGQRTARWFVDEATGEVRPAASWKSPRSYREDAATTAYVLALIALPPQPVQGDPVYR